MRTAITALIFGFACAVGGAWAQQPRPLYSPDDFAKAIEAVPCDEGQTRDNGGLCRADSASTRGFNLGVRARPIHKELAAARPARTGSASMLDDLRITFQSGSSELTPEGAAEAKNFAEALTIPWLSKRRFEIAGHTDASGSKRLNMALSQARAEAVLEVLVANGVDRSRLEAKGYGSSQLALPDAPRDAANRRVEARSLN